MTLYPQLPQPNPNLSITQSPISSPFQLNQYISQSSLLDFFVCPRPYVFQLWLDDIPPHEAKTCTDAFKFYLLCQAVDLRYKDFSYKKQLEIGKALIRKESGLADFKKPVLSAHHFHTHVWVKFQNTICLDPTKAATVFTSKRNKKRMRYINFISDKFSNFFHEVYCHATKKLGLSESAKNLCECMMQYAKQEYPTCPICSKLKMTKYQFWTFFYRHGGN